MPRFKFDLFYLFMSEWGIPYVFLRHCLLISSRRYLNILSLRRGRFLLSLVAHQSFLWIAACNENDRITFNIIRTFPSCFPSHRMSAIDSKASFMLTSHEQHFRLLLYRPHIPVAVLVLVHHVDHFGHVAEHEVAVAVVCLNVFPRSSDLSFLRE